MTTPVKRVHLVFKTHLDLGFTELARDVVKRYFEQYIPHALGMAEELRRADGPDRFVWTTGSWLIYELLERAPSAERKRLEQAIVAGDIRWHGLPFTLHSELLDADLFRFGLSLSQELDQRFGKHTIAAKMTDVPGHTRGIVPLLAEAGIQFLHIGVNPAATPPDVPALFTWRAPDDNEIVVMYQKGSYGDLQTVPGLDEALAFAHTEDNLGPQTIEQVHAAFAHLRAALPGAEIVASTMDAFAQTLGPIKPQLPVVSREIGDTWIHGTASDPKKLGQFRELERMRGAWLRQGRVDPNSKSFKTFSRALLQVPEHTWGLDVKTHLADTENFSRERFEAARGQPNFSKMESSWQEQRAYIGEAVQALGETPFRQEAQAALQNLLPRRADTTEMTRVDDPLREIETRHWTLRLDERGAIMRLHEKQTGREWADASHPLGLFCYETFDATDYQRFYKQYILETPENAWWAVADNIKPGLDAEQVEHRDWFPRLRMLHQKESADGVHLILELGMPATAVEQYGCPATVTIELEFAEADPAIRFTLQWFEKRATRLPEAVWFSFCPRVPAAKGWTMDKLGQSVSPLDVVRNGNRHLHGVGRGVRYEGGDLRFAIESREAALVAPGTRSLLDFNNRQPPLSQGMHWLLYNNVWGTNFTMWYEDDARFEFLLRPLHETR